MRDLIESLLGILIVIAVSWLIGFRIGRNMVGHEPGDTEHADSTTTIDSIFFEKPVAKETTVIRYVHVKAPIVPASKDSVPASKASIPDSAIVEVPIERKVYQEDSLYRAVVSGYRVSLDSLAIFQRTTTITVYRPVAAPKPSKWSLGVTVGPSALVTPNGRLFGGVGASIGISYRF